MKIVCHDIARIKYKAPKNTKIKFNGNLWKIIRVKQFIYRKYLMKVSLEGKKCDSSSEEMKARLQTKSKTTEGKCHAMKEGVMN